MSLLVAEDQAQVFAVQPVRNHEELLNAVPTQPPRPPHPPPRGNDSGVLADEDEELRAALL